MIPLMTPEAAMKVLPKLLFQGDVHDVADSIETDEALMFSSVLDLLVSVDENPKSKAENTESTGISSVVPARVPHHDTADAPAFAPVNTGPSPHPEHDATPDMPLSDATDPPVELAAAPTMADTPVPVAIRNQSDLPVAPKSEKRITFAQTVLEGRLPFSPASVSSKVADGPQVGFGTEKPDKSGLRDGPPTLSTKVGNDKTTLASTAVPAKAMLENGQNESLRIEQSPSALQMPFVTKERPLREKAAMPESRHYGALSDLPKTQTIPPPHAHQTAIATTPKADTSQQSSTEQSNSLITGKVVAPEMVLQTVPTERAVTALQPQTSTAAPTTAGVETARQVANQMAIAVSGQPGRATEIALNPEELGRVRLTMTAVDQAIVLNIAAERPETADLMRRHIDALAQELRALGYDKVAFSFGGSRDDTSGNGNADTRSDNSILETDKADTQTVAQQHGQSGTGLDLRL